MQVTIEVGVPGLDGEAEGDARMGRRRRVGDDGDILDERGRPVVVLGVFVLPY